MQIQTQTHTHTFTPVNKWTLHYIKIDPHTLIFYSCWDVAAHSWIWVV